jgi:CDP-2,3-bis-(O-geranylgeranyl)-sn-glycerol synthase
VSLLVAAAVLVAWQATVEAVKRRRPGISPELPRKLVHIGSGLVTAALPFFLSFRAIGLLAVVFVAGMALSRRLRIFTSVHDAGRTSYGELFYPLGIALLAATQPTRVQFVYAVLVLALADGFAAIVGSRARRGRLPSGKSAAGTATFFAIAALVGVSTGASLATALVAAAALALVEVALRFGLDNLVLPPLAGLLIGIHVDPQPLLRALWLVAPVVLAGAVHSIVIHRDLLPRLARPLDGGRMFRGRRLFGANKTWRGVIVMSATSAVAAAALTPRFVDVPVRVAGPAGFALLGLTLGLAYSLAELPNSFVKRRLGIAPGAQTAGRRTTQFVLDQLDSVVGVVAVLAIFVRDPAVLVATVPLGLALHVVADCLLYVFHVKPSPAVVLAAAPAEAVA